MRFVCSLYVVLAALGSEAAAAYVPVFGGPEYSSSADTGYANAWQPSFTKVVNDSGTAIGTAEKLGSGADTGFRAVRWDGSGASAIELPLPAGTTYSTVTSLNNSGTVAGYIDKRVAGNNVGARAMRWDGSGTSVTELDNLGTDNSGVTSTYTSGINNGGTIVGYADKYVSGTRIGTRAVRWAATGTDATELAHLTTNGYTDSYAWAVNDSGTTVGYQQRPGATRAVRWAGTGTSMVLLDFPTGGYVRTFALAVNESGTTVGYGDRNASGTDRSAIRWSGSGTSVVVLDRLGTATTGSNVAYALNDSGTTVGRATKFVSGINVGARAVRWDGSGTSVTELDNFGTDSSGNLQSSAEDINNSGIAVGWTGTFLSGTYNGDHAVAWMSDGQIIDLNTLVDPASGWTLSSAYGISDTGWISGVGFFDPDGAGGDASYMRLYVMQIPEPSTLLLAAFGTVGLLARRRT